MPGLPSPRHVGILLRDPEDLSLLARVARRFNDHGIEATFAGDAAGPCISPETHFDLVLAVGGDGTVLQALHSYPGTPVAGINCGTIGFLTAGEMMDVERLTERLIHSDCLVEDRLVLECSHNGQVRRIINEAVVKGTVRMVQIDVVIDDIPVHSYRGDGVIIGTPTGSTSYLMSTGSPIVMPLVDCYVLNGINEHRFSARSIVVRGTSIVRLRINPASRDPEIFLSHDGRDKIALAPGDEIEIRKGAEPARLVFFERNYFFKNLKSRLNW